MHWTKQLIALEQNKQWDEAIQFMESHLSNNPNDMDAYIAMNYLLMNLLVEEDYDETKTDYYEILIKHYFQESYAQFSHNPEYLYYTGRTAVMSEWYFAIEQADYTIMLKQALNLDPDNMIYQWTYYGSLARKNSEDETVIAYAKNILDANSPIQKTLQSKGAIGEYLLDMMTNWATKVITKYPYF